MSLWSEASLFYFPFAPLSDVLAAPPFHLLAEHLGSYVQGAVGIMTQMSGKGQGEDNDVGGVSFLKAIDLASGY